MNRHFFNFMICTVLAAALFSGCAKKTTSEINAPAEQSPAEAQLTAAEKPAAQTAAPVKTENELAEQAYMDFLNGKTRVTTSEKFREDDKDYNYDGLTYGTYDYEALKAAITELEGHELNTQYALVDLGHDGINELALRFQNTDPSFMNWVGVLHYSSGGLRLNYAYEDGYRSYSTLYTSGYLQIGGAISAGASISSIVGFDGSGVGSNVFSVTEYYGIFACSIAYDLREDGIDLSASYDDIAGDSQFFVREYNDGSTVKISAGMWSEDPGVRQREEALIRALVELGAVQVSEEEMDNLCSLTPYVSDEVSWQDWNA